MLRTCAGEVRRHRVDRVGQIFPRAADAGHFGLAAQNAFGADFARHARHFRGETVELVHHGVDRVFQLQNFALHVHRDLARQVAFGHGGGHFGDVADLRREIRGHGIDVIRQIFPRAGDAGNDGLAAEFAFGADFARHAGDFGGEGVQLVHHRIDRVLQLQNFALHVHRDFPGQVAARNGGGHVRDVADLAGEVGRHGIDIVGQIFPRAGDAGHEGLSAQFSFGADFARHARHFGGERAELVHHRVDRFLELENFAAHVHGDLFRQIAVGHGNRHFGDVADLRREVAGHLIHGLGEFAPDAGDTFHLRLAAEFAFGAHFARDADHFHGETGELFHHAVDEFGRAQVFTLQRASADFERHGLRQIALGHGADDAAHFHDRLREIVHQ